MSTFFYSRPETEEEAAQREAEAAEARRPLAWSEYRERRDSLSLHERQNDLFRLDLSTVPEDQRDLIAVIRQNEERKRGLIR